MPLRDHFRAPDASVFPWRSLHTVWPSWIMQRLNEVLPQGFRALPSVSLGVQAQVDVAALEEEGDAPAENGANGAGVATAVWAPPRPPLVVPARFAGFDRIEVQVFDNEESLRLVGAVELVSPGNKDRPEARRVFAAKVASYLQERIGVVVVDVVTERQHNLHAELIELLGLGEQAAAVASADLYAVAYHVRGEGKKTRLEVWPASLAVGSPLPTLPLWIGEDLAVPLDLEGSYVAACQMFRTS
jgi:hypothetical protein